MNSWTQQTRLPGSSCCLMRSTPYCARIGLLFPGSSFQSLGISAISHITGPRRPPTAAMGAHIKVASLQRETEKKTNLTLCLADGRFLPLEIHTELLVWLLVRVSLAETPHATARLYYLSYMGESTFPFALIRTHQ